MGYMEEVFSRAETKYVSIEKQIEWLSGFGERGFNDYEKAALTAAESLRSSQDIKEKTKTAGIVLIESLEQQAKEIQIVKLRRETLSEIRDRKSELEKAIESESKNIEREFKYKIKEADTAEEVQQILNQTDSPTIPQKTRNKINDEAGRRIKELRKARAKELEKEQQAAKVERLKQEKAEREAEKARKEEERQAKSAEDNRIREEREAEIAREKEQREEELLKEALKEERRIAEQIAREQMREAR